MTSPRPTPQMQHTYDTQGVRGDLRTTDTERRLEPYGVAPLDRTYSYWAGQKMRPLIHTVGGTSNLFNTPVSGALSLGLPAAALGWGVGKLYNRFAPPTLRQFVPEVNTTPLAALTGLLGSALGLYLGHSRQMAKRSSVWPSFQTPFPQPPLPSMSVPSMGMLPAPSWPVMMPIPVPAAMPAPTGHMAKDPFDEIAQAIENSNLPAPVQLQALSALPSLSPRDSFALADVVGGVSGALAGAVVAKFLSDKGLLAPVGGALLGGWLGSNLGR